MRSPKTERRKRTIHVVYTITFGHPSFTSLHFLIKDNKRLTPKLPGPELLELIRKDFIAKMCKLLFGLCEGCPLLSRFFAIIYIRQQQHHQ